MENIGQRIAAAMEAKGMGLRPTKDALGCSISALEQWLKGWRVPLPKWAPMLADFLGEPERDVREELLRAHGYLADNETLVTTHPAPSPGGAPARAKRKTPARKIPPNPETLTRLYPLSPLTIGAAA